MDWNPDMSQAPKGKMVKFDRTYTRGVITNKDIIPRVV